MTGLQGLRPGPLLELLKETYAEWNEDRAPRLGAALAYYTIFSLAPLLVVLMGIIGVFYNGSDRILRTQLKGLMAPAAAKAVQDMLQNANQNPSGGVMATVIGLATLLLGAGGVFGQLQDALNTIWEVRPKPGGGVMAMLRARFLSFSMVLGTGFLLLVSLFISTLLAGVGEYMSNALPLPPFVMQSLNFALGFVLITLLFAMIFKLLPDVQIAWHDVWIGAAMTSLLFSIGKLGLGLYLGKSSVASAYGAAGSLAVLLLWIYYAAQILFFGAEFTQVYAKKYGSKIVPAPGAEMVTAQARAQQGMTKSAVAPIGPPVGAKNTPLTAAKPPKTVGDADFLWPAIAGFLALLLWRRRKD